MKKTTDLSKWCAPEKEFIVEDWLSVGDISFLKGERGVGKSLLAQQLMTAVAIGKPWLNMDVKQVKTYGVFCDDEKEDLIRKQRAINRLYQLDESLVKSQMQMLARSGEDNLLMTFNYGGELTTFFHEVLEDIRSLRPKLVILDSASDLFEGGPSNFEEFIQVCCAYIARVLDCAVLVCEHDSSINVCNDKVWSLSHSNEANDERILHYGRSSHLLRYQDNVFVI